jgi:hypothetical protein
VERGSLVAKALLTSAQGPEVLGGLGNGVIKQVESDTALLLCDGNILLANVDVTTRWKKEGGGNSRMLLGH